MIVKCNCFLFNKKLSDLGVSTSDEKVRFSFLSEEIASIREVIDDGQDDVAKDKCCLYFKSGDSIWIDLSFDEAFSKIFKL